MGPPLGVGSARVRVAADVGGCCCVGESCCRHTGRACAQRMSLSLLTFERWGSTVAFALVTQRKFNGDAGRGEKHVQALIKEVVNT